MTWIAAAIFTNAAVGAWSANNAASQQQSAAENAAQVQQNIYNQTLQNTQPYMEAGRTALGQIGGMGDYFNHQFNAADLRNGLSPNYEFMLGQGLRQVGNAANTSGSRLGGNSLAGLTRYAEDYAGNAYQQAFNNFNTQRSDIFNRLSSIAGLGENAAVQAGNTGGQAGSNIANTMLGGANAGAAGTIGTANAVSNGLGSYLGWNYLNSRPTGGPGSNYLNSTGWSPGDNGPTYYGSGP